MPMEKSRTSEENLSLLDRPKNSLLGVRVTKEVSESQKKLSLLDRPNNSLLGV